MFIENLKKNPVILVYKDAQEKDGYGRKFIVPGTVSNGTVMEQNSLTDAQWAAVQEMDRNKLFFVDGDHLVARNAPCKWLRGADEPAPAAVTTKPRRGPGRPKKAA